ncbi:MAG: hypothetical protein Kow0032_21230 [Methyloligellaceae bacterium]
MSATTYTEIRGGKSGASFGGWLLRLFERMIEAQELRVRERVQAILRTYDDEVLLDIGYTPEEIEQLRKGELVAAPRA